MPRLPDATHLQAAERHARQAAGLPRWQWARALAVVGLFLGLVLLARYERDHPGGGYALASYLLYGLTLWIAGLGFWARRRHEPGPASSAPDPSKR